MSTALTAMVVTPGLTYTTRDGTPYRADWSGIVHVRATHVTELTAITPKNQAGATTGAVPAQATTGDVGATHHRGAPLIWNAENT